LPQLQQLLRLQQLPLLLKLLQLQLVAAAVTTAASIATTATTSSRKLPVQQSASSNSISMMRLSTKARNNDLLGSSSTHSIGNRRRLRKEADVDQKTVSSAMEKALLGSSERDWTAANSTWDCEDQGGDDIPVPPEKPRRALSADISLALPPEKPRRAASEDICPLVGVSTTKRNDKNHHVDDDDNGLDLLDAVFQD